MSELKDEDYPMYTVAVCNYNMADTVERSLRSILDQVNDQFEVLVIDDGSTDGSIRILERLEQEYSVFRFEIGDNNNLAEARNESFERSNGKYILESLDTDDVYDDIILDFVRIFHAFEDTREDDFYLKGASINMAKKELLLNYPYRSLGYGEDKDLWRRLFKNDAIVWLDHIPPCETIGYDRSRKKIISVEFEHSTVELRSGITVWSHLQWHLLESISGRHLPRRLALLRAVLTLPAFFVALLRGRYEPVDGFEQKGKLKSTIDEHAKTLSEHISANNVEFDVSSMSEPGQHYLANGYR